MYAWVCENRAVCFPFTTRTLLIIHHNSGMRGKINLAWPTWIKLVRTELTRLSHCEMFNPNWVRFLMHIKEYFQTVWCVQRRGHNFVNLRFFFSQKRTPWCYFNDGTQLHNVKLETASWTYIKYYHFMQWKSLRNLEHCFAFKIMWSQHVLW